MIESLQELDLSKRCDRKAILFVVYQYFLERNNLPCLLRFCFGDFTKSAFAEFANPFVLLNL